MSPLAPSSNTTHSVNLISVMINIDYQENFIIFASVLSIIYGIINAYLVLRVKVSRELDKSGREVDDESENIRTQLSASKLREMEEISRLIREGAHTFLKTQYISISIFCAIFAVIIACVVEKEKYTYYVTCAFILGALTSIASGYIGMWISVRTNVRVSKMANSSLHDAFIVAFRGGSVLGFCLVGLGLLNLVLIIMVYKKIFLNLNVSVKGRGFKEMFEVIAGYGLGGSAVALFGRVGGGIYTKAADVGADLVGKVVHDLDEDSIMNPGTIADNVGDNVGDIAGMGADLFGSFAESTCACLVISGTSNELITQSGYYFPLLISATGIFVCFLTSLVASIGCIKTDSMSRVMIQLNLQLLISTLLMTPVLYACTYYFLPPTFTLYSDSNAITITVKSIECFYCCALGLWSGYVIGYTTNYYTSAEYSPV